jgi:hypothetical protein
MKNVIVGTILLGALSVQLALAAAVRGPNVGSKADVAALRAAVTAKAQRLQTVHVIGNYALLEWSDPNEDGVSVYKRTSGERWTFVTDSNLFSVPLLIQAGVPATVARGLCAGWPRAYAACIP